MEHTGASLETIKVQCAACRGLGLAPLVRVPATEYHFIARVLDVGAHGVMIPMVETWEQAEFIVACASYPPKGRRGAAFAVSHDDYLPGAPADKMKAAAARTLLIPQIETRKGLENVESIAGVDGIDVVREEGMDVRLRPRIGSINLGDTPVDDVGCELLEASTLQLLSDIDECVVGRAGQPFLRVQRMSHSPTKFPCTHFEGVVPSRMLDESVQYCLLVVEKVLKFINEKEEMLSCKRSLLRQRLH